MKRDPGFYEMSRENYIRTLTHIQAEQDKWSEFDNFYNSLTDEEKKDIIEVDGKRYIRKIYERNHPNG